MTHHPAIIPTQKLKLLGLFRTRLQHFQMRLVSAHKLSQDVGVKQIALRVAHPVAIPYTIHSLGIDRIDRHPVIEQKIHNPPRRFLNGRPQFTSLDSFLIEPPPHLGQILRSLCHLDLFGLVALLVAHAYLMQAIPPIYSNVVTLHCLALLYFRIPIPIAPNGKFALYRSSPAGRLSIEPLIPFSYRRDSLSLIFKRDGEGLVLIQQALKSVSHKHDLHRVNLQRCQYKERERFAAYIPDGDLGKFACDLPQMLRKNFTETMALLRNERFQKLLIDYRRSPEPSLLLTI